MTLQYGPVLVELTAINFKSEVGDKDQFALIIDLKAEVGYSYIESLNSNIVTGYSEQGVKVDMHLET